jgi:hypothetical protein
MQSRQTPPPVTVDLYGLKLTFQTPNAALRKRFETVYGHLAGPAGAKTDVLVEWRLHAGPLAPLPPPDSPTIADGELVSYYNAGSRILIRMPKYGLIAVDLTTNHLRGTVTRNCLEVYGAFEDVLMISLAPLYRRRGWFPLHAFAALSPGGKAALITGAMGSGKTTTGLALLSAGWKLLSNDSPLLCLIENRVEVLAYPGRLSAFDDSLARFESLHKFIPAESGIKREKRVFNAEEAFAEPWAESGAAGGVFFPQVVAGLSHSELVEVSPTEAVLELLPQAVEGWDKAAIAQNLQLLSKLVQQVPCYRLRLSPQVTELPSLLAAAMQK